VKSRGPISGSQRVVVFGESHVEVANAPAAGSLNLSILSIEGQDTAGDSSGYRMLGEAGLLCSVSVFHENGELILLDGKKRKSLGMYLNKRNVELESLPEGNLILRIEGYCVETQDIPFSISANQTTKLERKVYRGASVLVQIENDIDLDKIQRAEIDVSDNLGNAVQFDRIGRSLGLDLTDLATRTIRVTPLKAGRYTIELKVDGFQSSTFVVNVPRSSIVKGNLKLIAE